VSDVKLGGFRSFALICSDALVAGTGNAQKQKKLKQTMEIRSSDLFPLFCRLVFCQLVRFCIAWSYVRLVGSDSLVTLIHGTNCVGTFERSPFSSYFFFHTDENTTDFHSKIVCFLFVFFLFVFDLMSLF
jgi:hypothetical protein